MGNVAYDHLQIDPVSSQPAAKILTASGLLAVQGVDMGVYYSRSHLTLGERLVDAAIGTGVGMLLAVVLWVVSLWVWAAYGWP